MTTATVSQNAEQQQRVREAMERQPRLLLGERSSHELEKDPRHLLFVLSRYKFVAKMLADRGRILEVGIGDGLGASLVAQAGNTVIGIDLETLGLDHAADTRWTRERMQFAQHDMVAAPFVPEGGLFDGGYTLDVIEHINPAQEQLFLQNIVRSLRPEAPLIVGTPNEAAKAYASKEALEQHINWKSFKSLHESLMPFYHNVFLFGMNDEVLHTGYAPMCHYVFALCTQPR